MNINSSSPSAQRAAGADGGGGDTRKQIRITIYEDSKPNSPESGLYSRNNVNASKRLTNTEICETLTKLRTFLKSSETEKTTKPYASPSPPPSTLPLDASDIISKPKDDAAEPTNICQSSNKNISYKPPRPTYRPPWIFEEEEEAEESKPAVDHDQVQSPFSTPRSSQRSYVYKVEHHRPSKPPQLPFVSKDSAVGRFHRFLGLTKKPPMNQGVKVSVKPIIHPSVLQDIQAMQNYQFKSRQHNEQASTSAATMMTGQFQDEYSRDDFENRNDNYNFVSEPQAPLSTAWNNGNYSCLHIDDFGYHKRPTKFSTQAYSFQNRNMIGDQGKFGR